MFLRKQFWESKFEKVFFEKYFFERITLKNVFFVKCIFWESNFENVFFKGSILKECNGEYFLNIFFFITHFINFKLFQ